MTTTARLEADSTDIGVVTTTVTFDWEKIGAAFASESADEQMSFLVGMTERMRSWGSIEPAMQAHLIAHNFQMESPTFARTVAQTLDLIADALRDVDPEVVPA